MTQIEPIVVDAAVVWLITLFAFTGVMKLVSYRSSVASVGRYDAVAGRTVARGAGYALPWMEVVVAAAIAVSPSRSAGGWAAACLGVAFATVGGLAVRAKLNVGCGCGGRESRNRVGMATVARGLLIAAAGATIALMARRSTIETPFIAGLTLGAACPGLLLKWQDLGRIRMRAQAVQVQPPLPTTKQ